MLEIEAVWAMLQLTWLLASFSLLRPGFAPWSVRVGFVVGKVTLRQIFLRVLQFGAVNIIPTWLSILHSYLNR
jgi:hypothetical protein